MLQLQVPQLVLSVCGEGRIISLLGGFVLWASTGRYPVDGPVIRACDSTLSGAMIHCTVRVAAESQGFDSLVERSQIPSKYRVLLASQGAFESADKEFPVEVPIDTTQVQDAVQCPSEGGPRT